MRILAFFAAMLFAAPVLADCGCGNPACNCAGPSASSGQPLFAPQAVPVTQVPIIQRQPVVVGYREYVGYVIGRGGRPYPVRYRVREK